jgi:flagellar export protein FliJ
MADKEYRLQALVGIRERKKEEAEKYLGTCLAALKVEQQRLRDMEEELDRMIARREARKREYAEKAMRGEMSAQAAISANLYIERLKEQEQMQKDAIEGQKGVVQQKKEDVDGARQDLVKAEQELKALEKHKEKWQEERKKEIAAKQEEVMDEIAQSGFLRRKAETGD